MSLLKGLISNSIVYSLPPIISSVGNLILLPIWTAYLSPTDYGILTMLAVAGNIMTLLVWLNINSGVLRFYHQYQGEERPKYLGTMAIGVLVWSLLVSSVFIVFIHFLSGLFFSEESNKYLPFMVAEVCIVFTSASSIIIGAIYINQQKSKKWSLLQLISWVLTVMFSIYFVVYGGEGAWGKVKGQLIVAICLFFVYWVLSLKYLAWCFSWRIFKETLLFGMPLLFKGASQFAFQYSGRWILERTSSLDQVGLYGFSDSVAQLMRVPFRAFSTAWMPVFYKEATADPEAAKSLTREMSFYWAIFMLSVTLIFCLNIKSLIILLVNVRYQVDVVYQSIAILALGYFLASLQVFFIYSLGFMKKTMSIFMASLLAAVLNLGLNLTLIPTYGILAAAWATVAAYSVSLVYMGVRSQKLFRVSFKWALFARGLLLALAAYGTSALLPLENPWFSLAANTGLFTLYLVGLLAFGVVQPAMLKEAWTRIANARD
ncbi:MAG: oligosaccharide flippase family protein [Proteobacteria bacterium]|nr:oligosaccharide flippase family protein [Pseudomonadota bacterium]MBU4384639.1 oligosaccharide flippase family protein [Pseudomonadota bacterium]MCG2766213.1 oligosaccharide flippase family protein [Desulfarculaceae bacterium]